MSFESHLASAPGQGRKSFVLDTNVLLYDPKCLNVFGGQEVVIPITVIEEVDKFKKDLNETGRNARTVSRKLDELRRQGSLSEGVPIGDGSTVRIVMVADDVQLPPSLSNRTNDNLILSVVVDLAKERGHDHVVFVTRDTNMRIKADAMGIIAEDYEHAHVGVDENYTGVVDLTLPGAAIGDVYGRGWLPWTADEALSARLSPNQFVIAHSEDNPNQSALLRYDQSGERLKLVPRHKEGVWGIFARNKEQLFALDLLLDDSVSLVTLDGMAGTGKTLLAIACGLRLVADESRYRRLVVSRPIFPLGRDIGFLPGDLSEKLNPWMKPIFDNLDLLVGSNIDDGRGGGNRRNDNSRVPGYQPLLDQGLIEVEPLTYIRGRSLPRQYLIVDEAQNLTPHEVKTVITRAGEGTKVVLTGDPYQIDNPYVDAMSNGLTYVVERFKDSPVAGHVTLRKGERSQLAELAAKVL
jgi:PhoH-like ATPase